MKKGRVIPLPFSNPMLIYLKCQMAWTFGILRALLQKAMLTSIIRNSVSVSIGVEMFDNLNRLRYTWVSKRDDGNEYARTKHNDK